METFEKEYRGNVVVITVNLVSATLNDTNEFKGFMEELILLTECDVVIDLSTCNHLDSTFIGALVMSFKKLKMKNRNMVLVEPNDQTKVFLTMNSLSKIFHLYPDVEVAVEDLLNRNIIENNLTNMNHQVILDEKTESSNDNGKALVDESINSQTTLEINEEIAEKLNLKEKVKEKVNLTAMEETSNEEVKNINDEKSLNDIKSVTENKTHEEVLANDEKEIEDNISDDYLSKIDENLNEAETDMYAAAEYENEMTTQHNDIERDYRQGTVAWDFGL